MDEQFFPPQNNNSSSSGSSSNSSVSSPSTGSRRSPISPASNKFQSPPPLVPECFSNIMQHISLSSSSIDSNFSGRSSVYAMNDQSTRSAGTSAPGNLTPEFRISRAHAPGITSLPPTDDHPAALTFFPQFVLDPYSVSISILNYFKKSIILYSSCEKHHNGKANILVSVYIGSHRLIPLLRYHLALSNTNTELSPLS